MSATAGRVTPSSVETPKGPIPPISGRANEADGKQKSLSVCVCVRECEWQWETWRWERGEAHQISPVPSRPDEKRGIPGGPSGQVPKLAGTTPPLLRY